MVRVDCREHAWPLPFDYCGDPDRVGGSGRSIAAPKITSESPAVVILGIGGMIATELQ